MAWKISGQYMETCNCTLLCPCIWSNLAATPTEGSCKAAVALRVDKGEKDGVALDGTKFVVMLLSPGPMGAGNMTVGLIIDSAATDAQADAIAAIATGSAGGPMAALAPLVGKVAGIERKPVTFEHSGATWSVRAGDLLDQSCEALPSLVDPSQPITIDNVGHPVNTKLALAKATRSVMNVFGIQWDAGRAGGTRNGHFASFSWAG